MNRIRSLALGGVLSLVVACAQNDADVRVVHAAPGAPAVDVYLQGERDPLVRNLSYGEVSSMEGLENGSYVFEVRPVGADANSAAVFTSPSIAVAEDARITVVAAGQLNPQNTANNFRLLPFVEEFTGEAHNQARIRVIHAAVGAPAVDLDLGDDGSREITGLAPFGETGAAGIAIPSGQEQQLTVFAGQTRVTTFTLPSLPDRGELFVVVAGLADVDPGRQTGLSLIVADDDERIAWVRQNPVAYVLHASVGTPAIDVFNANQELVNNLAFGQLSGRIQLRPGSYPVDLFPTSAGTTRPGGAPAVSGSTSNLVAGRSYLLAATGYLQPQAGQPAFQLLAFESTFAEDADNARVRAIHLAPGAPAVDVGRIVGTTFTPIQGLTNLTYPNASAAEGVVVPGGATVLGIAPTGTITPVASFSVDLRAGTRVFAIAAGSLQPGATDPFRLIQVDASNATWSASSLPPR